MAAPPGSLLAAALLLLVSSGLHRSSSLPPCPESCSCQRAPLLNCSSSGLSSVPPHIPDSVTELDLSHNLLDSVTLDRPRRDLRRIHLGNNSIARLSFCVETNVRGRYGRGGFLNNGWRPRRGRGCVSWAPTLQLLSVERNQLEQLPQGLEGSESLQVLQLSFNRISTLRPGELSRLRRLKELHLQHNLITSLHPQMFQDLAQLQVLDLSFNMLTSLHPLTYISLRNIGADVMLGGNRWRCDCSMRSLRSRMIYDSSGGLQAWSVVCDSPSVLSGRDLLQLEEEDLNCFSPENGPELHRDVTVYRGSEILLSCSTQDSMWWTPSGQAPVSQPEAGLVISDIAETDTGLYVCVSEEDKVVSVFNLQISKIEGAGRKTRSAPRIPEGTRNEIGQERNQRATQSDLTLAVCLSVFITFLIAFILGVLARPCIDALCRRVTRKKKSSSPNSVSSVEQRQYDNAAFYDGEEPEYVGPHRERRVTFSTVDYREDGNVKYYDTVAAGNQGTIHSDAVIECEGAEAERFTNTAGDSGSENSLRQSSPEHNHRDLADAGRTHNMEFEHIPDPDELVKRRSLSSSDSSLYDKELNEDQMIRGDHSTPKTPQQAEDSVQQRADSTTARNVEVPHISIEVTSELPGFSSEPFADWSPPTNNTNLTDLWQENEEQFEFSDSVRSTSARSSGVLDSFKDSKLIVAPTSDKQKMDDMSSSSSYVSENELTRYVVNSDPEEEEEEDIERNHNKPEVSKAGLNQGASFEQQIHGVDPIWSSVRFDQGDVQRPAMSRRDSFSSNSSDSDGEEYRVKKWRIPSHSKSLDTRSHSPPPAYSSPSSSESEAEITDLKVEGRMNEGIKINEPETRQYSPQIKKRVDINAPLPASDSSGSDESTDETTKQHKQVEVGLAGLPVKEHQSVSQDAMNPQWPTLKAPSPASFSSSDSEDEATHHTERSGKVGIAGLPYQESQTGSHDPGTRWAALDLEDTMYIKRRIDIKATSPCPDSSSSSDSEDETTGYMKKQEHGQMNMDKVSQNISHDPQLQWPVLDVEDTMLVKRQLDVKAPSPVSSSDSEDETTHHIKKERPGLVGIAGLPYQESHTERHDSQTRWPALDLEHTMRVKRRLDVKAPSPPPDSSSSSDSEDETTGHMKNQEQGQMNMDKVSQNISHDPQPQWPVLDLERTMRVKRRLDVKAPSPPPDSSSSSDSEDETTHHIKKERPGVVGIAGLPYQESHTERHDPQTRWPAPDLEGTMRVKRRLDVKAPSSPPDSSSGSDSEDETTHHIKKERPGVVGIAGLPYQESHTERHDPQTRWPALDLEPTMRIKRRLDVKAPSPPPDSSSSSDSEDETTGHVKNQEQGQMNMDKVSQNISHDPQPQWPVLDLEGTMRVKRRLDVKAPSPLPDSSSSSDIEYETTHHIKKERPGVVGIAGLPYQESHTEHHDPQTGWPAPDLERTMRVKRRLDVKAPSPPPDSSSSSDSEHETTGHMKKQEQGKMNMDKVSQIISHDPQPQWPVLDLERTMRVKRRLDVKAPSPPPDSSSSSDSEDETTGHTERQGKVDITGLPFQESQRGSHDPDTKWPVLDLEGTMRIKRRLDVKAPSPATVSETGVGGGQKQGALARLQSKVSQTASYDPQAQWPSIDLDHTMRIKRRLDIKAPSPPPVSLVSGGSTNHTVEEKRGEALKIRLRHSSSSSDEQEGVEVDPNSRWPRLDLSSAIHVKRRLDVKARTPPPESSSSSVHEGWTTVLPVKVETKLPKLSPSVSYINRRLDFKAPSPQPDSESNSSRSDREDEYRDHAKIGLGVSATSKVTEREFIRSPKTPVINISRSPKTDIKLEKYTDITNEVGDKTTSDNIGTTPEMNPELQSRWATMNLGISRFRKRLEITSPTHEPPNLPSTPPPDSPSSSSSESGKSSTTGRKRRGVGEQGIIHTESSENKPVNVSLSLKGQDVNSGNSVEVSERLRKDYSLPTTEEKSNQDAKLTGTPHFRKYLDFKVREKAPAIPPPLDQPQSHQNHHSNNSEDEIIVHSVPDLSLGVPRIKRRLDVKAPLPEPSNSPSSSSESENEVTAYNQSRLASNLSVMTEDNSLITYKRVIMKASLPPSNSFSSSGKGQTMDITKQRLGDRNTSLAPKKVTSMSFDDIVKKRLKQPRGTTDVDLPPEIKWTGVGRQLPDLPIPNPRRNLGVGLSSPPADPELPPPDSPNSSSSESDDNTKQEKTEMPLMPKHSSLGAYSVSLASSRALDKFDSPPSSTNESLRAVSEERNERKGLSALKAMSSERRRWDTDAHLDKGASPLFHDRGPKVDTSFNYRSSEKDIKPLAKQPPTQSLQRRALDLLYGVPSYRKHDVAPPQGSPPPVPTTPPPYEAVGRTWRSPQSGQKPGLEGTRNMEESDSSPLTTKKLAVYFDSSNENFTDV